MMNESMNAVDTIDASFAALDWQGQALDCAQCAQSVAKQSGQMVRCGLQVACVEDRYALRIDRFFRWNPALARQYLRHPYFEVRAIAAKYVDVFYLPQLVKDVDETVRWSAVHRLAPRQLLALRQDPDREVRIRVAARLPEANLISMMADEDYFVRTIVARRLPQALLSYMKYDKDAEVRAEVAKRISVDGLLDMAEDASEIVRLVVVHRLPMGYLGHLMNDIDWRVRYEVARRAGSDIWSRLLDDEDEAVREMAHSRQSTRATAQVTQMQFGVGGRR